MVKLNWGKNLNFNSENEYYEIMGFLVKNHCFTIEVESTGNNFIKILYKES